jgi:hypothetical protein
MLSELSLYKKYIIFIAIKDTTDIVEIISHFPRVSQTATSSSFVLTPVKWSNVLFCWYEIMIWSLLLLLTYHCLKGLLLQTSNGYSFLVKQSKIPAN